MYLFIIFIPTLFKDTMIVMYSFKLEKFQPILYLYQLEAYPKH